jgi:hypothetical protein
MEAWLAANRRKTARGMPRFVTAWLGRTQDKGGGTASLFARAPARVIAAAGDHSAFTQEDWDKALGGKG